MKNVQFELNAEVEMRHWWFAGRRRILCSLIEAVVPPSTNTTIVDIGCGTGGNMATLSARYDCLGVDISYEAIELARQRFPNQQFVCIPADDDIDGGTVKGELYLLADVLEHVRDDLLMLSKILADAPPRAYVLMTVPAELALWSRHDESHGHYRRYDRSRLERLWQGLPVTPLLVSSLNTRLYPVIKAVRTINRWRGRSYGDVDTDLKMPPRQVNWLLETIFAGEQKRLLNALRENGQSGDHVRSSPVSRRWPQRGVSLLALLRREEGDITPRTKPGDVAADYFDPELPPIRNDVTAKPTYAAIDNSCRD